MNKKYEIIKDGLDNYTLKYKDKEINFKSTIKIVDMMQEVNKNARMNMIMDLAEKGKSIKQLVIEEKRDGKTYYDNSSKEELEKTYIQAETSKVFQKAVKELTGMELINLIQEIGLEGEQEIRDFSTELSKAMMGSIPR